MKAKDLFTIILKVFGIYLIKDVLLSIPSVLDNFFRILAMSPDVGFFSLIFSLLVLGLHLAIVYLLLFKTSFIISKLNLTSDLSEEPMVLNMHRSSGLHNCHYSYRPCYFGVCYSCGSQTSLSLVRVRRFKRPDVWGRIS